MELSQQGVQEPHSKHRCHARRHTEALIWDASRRRRMRTASWCGMGVTPQQPVANLERRGELIQSCQPDEQTELEAL